MRAQKTRWFFNFGGPELKSTGAVTFHDNSTASHATIDVAAAGSGAFCAFQNQATAGSATIINRSGQTIFGGATIFSSSSTAGEATIINEGAPASGTWKHAFPLKFHRWKRNAHRQWFVIPGRGRRHYLFQHERIDRHAKFGRKRRNRRGQRRVHSSSSQFGSRGGPCRVVR